MILLKFLSFLYVVVFFGWGCCFSLYFILFYINIVTWFTIELNYLFFFLYFVILIFLRAPLSRFNGSNLIMDEEALLRDHSGVDVVFILTGLCFSPVLDSGSTAISPCDPELLLFPCGLQFCTSWISVTSCEQRRWLAFPSISVNSLQRRRAHLHLE